MEEKSVEQLEEMELEQLEKDALNEKGYSFAYNLTMVSAVATVTMFVLGTALYLTIVG